MKSPAHPGDVSNKKVIAKFIVSFIILFALYHAAEYMIVFKASTAGFFIFQGLFFLTAFLLGNWYNGKGLACWGLPFPGKYIRLIFLGMIAGILLYAIPFVLSLVFHIETITSYPVLRDAFNQGLLFALGVLFSSFSEDVLTRGLAYRQFHTVLKPGWLILLSASIYLLNHIYRLDDGMEALLYIFLLGVVFIIPVLFTKNLWFTGSMHWAGNTFFFVTHNLIQTENGSTQISSNYFFAIFLMLAIPITWQISWRLRATDNPTSA